MPTAVLPSSELGARPTGGKSRGEKISASPSITALDGAGAAAIAVLDAVMPRLLAAGADVAGEVVVRAAAQAVYAALLKLGLTENEAADVARRVGSEAARWDSTGRGTVISNWQWVQR